MPARCLRFTRKILSGGLCALSLVPFVGVPHRCRAQGRAPLPASGMQAESPEPAIPAILKAFQHYEVVGMPAAHGEKDMDDLILSLVRDPGFAAVVNDIVIECGNVRYQPVLDRYIAGEDVPFPEVEHVWRDTTVFQMCGASGFYEQLIPLVRSLNKSLPRGNRLRVVAADPPIDWSQIHSYQDLVPFFDRDGSIASVMESEVLSRQRKALMLFGIFHLIHGGGPGQGDAVTRFERRYPGRTFIISGLGYYGTGGDASPPMDGPGTLWPSLLLTKGSRLGALPLDAFLPTPITVNDQCDVVDAFAGASKAVAPQIDAFVFLGPQRFQLAEPLPADIGLDRTYRLEWLRRFRLVGLPAPATMDELDAQVVQSAADPMLHPPPRQNNTTELRARMKAQCLVTKHPAQGSAR